MEKTRNRWFRGAITLGVLATFGAAMLISNAGAVAEKKEASKKFVKQQVNRLRGEIPQIGNPVFIEEGGEFVRFAVKMSVEDPDVTLFRVGPFTVTANCYSQAGSKVAEATISTSEPNSAFGSNEYGAEYDFDPGETLTWTQTQSLSGASQTAQLGNGHAESPSGTYIDGSVLADAGLGGQDCTFFGWYTNITA